MSKGSYTKRTFLNELQTKAKTAIDTYNAQNPPKPRLPYQFCVRNEEQGVFAGLAPKFSNQDYKLIGDSKIELLEEGMIVKILTVDEEIVSINLPKNIKVEILNADAVVKGQTASSSFKNAETTKSIKLLVPPHIKAGDKIIINSENLEYVEKAKD